jgi:hypothetical protein
VWGVGCGVWGVGYRVGGLGSRGLGIGVHGFGGLLLESLTPIRSCPRVAFRVVSGFRGSGLGFRVYCCRARRYRTKKMRPEFGLSFSIFKVKVKLSPFRTKSARPVARKRYLTFPTRSHALRGFGCRVQGFGCAHPPHRSEAQTSPCFTFPTR